MSLKQRGPKENAKISSRPSVSLQQLTNSSNHTTFYVSPREQAIRNLHALRRKDCTEESHWAYHVFSRFSRSKINE